jgi:high-affinity Fe2+/Pb2+ permease
MFGFNKNKERERYYLLPGMGGRAVRAKQKIMLRWALAAGLITSALLGYALYYFSRNPQP